VSFGEPLFPGDESPAELTKRLREAIEAL